MTALSPTSQPASFRRWLMVFGWALFALAYLALFLTDLRSDFAQMLVPCAGEGCNFLSISSAEVAVLGSWGLSPRTYAYFMSAVPVVILVGYWILSGLILWRQGPSRAGWIVSLALIVLPVSTTSGSNNWAATYPALLLPAVILTLIGSIILVSFFYLMPNGRFSPRWSILSLMIFVFQITILTLDINGILTVSRDLRSIIIITTISNVLLVGAFQIYRYLRDSTKLERQQTKWISGGLLIYIFSVITWALIFGGGMDIPPGPPRLWASLVGWYSFIFTALSLPAAITFAILRYKLWDIDLIIRRTAQYAVLTGMLVLVYFGGVILLQILFDSLTGNPDSPIITVISTIAIAALFNPLRVRIQNFIDWRFYRRKLDSEMTLKEFAAVARDEVDMDRLTAALQVVVEKTMQPEHSSLWLIRDSRN